MAKADHVPSMSLRRLCAVLVLVALAGASAVAFSGADASAAASGRRECTPPKYPGKTGRSLDLTTFHLSCRRGREISLAHYRARVRRGGADGILKQNTRILGYRCFEQRLFNRGYYDGRVQCTRGRRVSVYIYRQNR